MAGVGEAVEVGLGHRVVQLPDAGEVDSGNPSSGLLVDSCLDRLDVDTRVSGLPPKPCPAGQMLVSVLSIQQPSHA